MALLRRRVTTVGLVLAMCASTAMAEEEKKELPAGDVIAKRLVRATPDDVYRQLMDFRFHEGLWPSGCTKKWEFGTTSTGVGANARLTYRSAMMRRRLTATIAEGDPGRYIKIDHAGRNGFATTWTLTDKGGDTSVEVHTWVDPPPWPLTKMYMNQVRPAWKSCHQGLLDNLARKVQSKP
jgi:uncharacterized protein YndB with AHSA1/START domain